MRDSIGRGIEWCELNQGRVCFCEQIYDIVETKCPDLGDWSDTPHDELDRDSFKTSWALINLGNRQIERDRDRLLSYIED